MKKKWLWIGLGVAVVLVLVGVNVARRGPGQGRRRCSSPRVRVEDITSRVRAPGKIEPKTQVKVSADIMGKVQRLLVKEGDRVKRGQLHAAARRHAVPLGARPGARRAVVGRGAAARGARRPLKVSESNYKRQRSLFEQKLLSQAEWDQATSANESAHVAVATAQRGSLAGAGGVDRRRGQPQQVPVPGAVRRRGERAQRRAGRDRDHRHHEQPGHADPGGLGPVAHAGARRRGRDRRRGHEARPEGQDHGGRAARHLVPGHGDRDRQHRQALARSRRVEGQTNFEVKVVFDDTCPRCGPA